MPTALVISRNFPPIGPAGGAIRLTKLLKYAKPEGWEFIILTQDPDNPVIDEGNISGFLLEDLPQELIIKRIPNPFPRKPGVLNFLGKFFGNSSLPWGICVFLEGLNVIRHQKIDLIFSNSPPFTNVGVGASLAKLKKLPFIIDVKDDWVGSSAYKLKNVIRKFLESWVEKTIIQQSQAVFFPTELSFSTYSKRYEDQTDITKFLLIPNGQDLDEYKSIQERKRDIVSEKFLILTAASGYRSNYRDLTIFLKAIAGFLRDYPQAKNNVELVFLGDPPAAEYSALITNLGLDQIIRSIPPVGRQEFVEWLWKADLFFLIQPKANFTAVSGTLYEYWATGKAPILVISEVGASSSLVTENNLGEHFNFGEPKRIADYIQRIYQAYSSQRPIWIGRDGVEKFDRKSLSLKMVSKMEEVRLGKNTK